MNNLGVLYLQSKLVIEDEIRSNGKIDVSGLKPGMYIVKIIDGKNNSLTIKKLTII
ncbi:T9SS type A sorting domain-containing protein [Salibacter sp.]|uniref:T9SS type A sorting domain-containing protein n=1 Tax=Salibacter sp. TaxID=2010995 RepID=UPI0038F6CF3B